jgi:pimeloyl-ACP methyl ester carboxylesterase
MPQVMQPPLEAERFEISDSGGRRVACYAAASAGTRTVQPLLLVHSVNAAATAYEMKPLFDHYRQQRPVYALDLPGFGLSDRSQRAYTPRLMTDAIKAITAEIRKRHDGMAIDMVALSLGCEFAARAASEEAGSFRTVTLISPTGFDKRSARAAQGAERGETRAMPWLHSFLNVPLWKRGLFSALTSRASIRFFLQKTWGSKDIDESLLEYDYITTHQPGAENAPYYFVSGYLFSKDALRLYQALTMPVWMAHGVRGDFVDYEQKTTVKNRPNWAITVFETGAMPHFEKPQQFITAYDQFMGRISST